MDINKSLIRKILVLRYRSIGDIILSSPALEALRLTFPSARIDMVIDDVFEDLCQGHPNIDYLILHKRDTSGMTWFQKAAMGFKFIAKIRKQKYDLVIDLHGGPRSAPLAWLSGARYRVGYRLRLRSKLFYNIPIPPDVSPASHTSDVLLNAVRAIGGVIPEVKKLYLGYRPEDMEFVTGFLRKFDISEKDRLVMVHPGARVDIKRLPAEKMGHLARWMTEELGVKVVYAGSNADIAEIAGIVSYSGRRGLIATNLKLGHLAALIASCDLLVGNDSGPMHMASALGVPTVSFFGPSDPALWGPLAPNAKVIRNAPLMECQPCDQKNCSHVGAHCMTKIKLGEAKRAIMNILTHRSAQRV